MELIIAYSTDDNYVQHVGVSMVSLFENNKEFENIVVYIMDTGISDINKQKLISISRKYNRKIIFSHIQDSIEKLNLNINGSISVASYARLFLGSIVDKSYNKILYLDCDSIIKDSLIEIWNEDISDYLIGGVLDTVDSTTKTKIGLSENDIYINAGMLLINLKEWRNQNIENEFIKFINRYDGNVFHHDQGTINGVLNGKIKILHPKFNCMTPFFMMKKEDIEIYYSVNKYYSQEDLDFAVSNSVFVHYTPALTTRPWVRGCTHPLRKEYLKYLSITPWKESSLNKDNRSKGLKLVCFIYNKLPFKIAHKICTKVFV